MENRKTTGVSERRHYERVPVQLPVTVRYRGRLIPATARNVSCGGMMLDTSGATFAEQDALELIFDLSALDRDITLRGEVVCSELSDTGRRVGVQFMNLFSIGHEAVTRFLKRQGGSGQH